MTTISSSTIFKSLCKFCHSPPSKFKKIGRMYKDERDLNQIIFDSSKEHYYYLISPYIINSFLMSNKGEKVKLNFINFSTSDFKICISGHKRHQLNFNKIRNKNINALLTCKCNKTHWVISCKDNSFYPELNRKSKIKKVF